MFALLLSYILDDNVFIAQSVRAGRSWDRIPMGTRFSAPVQTGPGAPPSHLYNEYRVLPGDKAAGARH